MELSVGMHKDLNAPCPERIKELAIPGEKGFEK